jgi:hypothetical protein
VIVTIHHQVHPDLSIAGGVGDRAGFECYNSSSRQGGGDILGEAVPPPSAINVAPTPLHMTSLPNTFWEGHGAGIAAPW